MTASDALERLRRPDRFTIGSGDGLLFAPWHPLWLDRPGFWDGVQWLMHELRPAFTWTLIDDTGRALPLRLVQRSATPADVIAEWRAGPVTVHERRALLPGGLIVAELDASGARGLHVVAWTALEAGDVDRSTCAASPDGVRWTARARHLHNADPLPLECALGFDGGPVRTCIAETQQGRDAPNRPDWDVSPFADLGFPLHADGTRTIDDDPEPQGRRLVCIAAARPFDGACTIALRLGSDAHTFTRPVEAARAAWRAYLEDAPALACDDAFLENVFAFRRASLRLNFLPASGRYGYPGCAEGTGFFHAAIAYSAWCHARELRWLPDPSRARGVLRNFFDRQRDDGSFPGILYADGEHPTASYFADWGASVLAVDEVHPDPGFLEEAYGPLKRYADHLRRERDAENSGLYDVRDPYETGQEYMSRYTAVDDRADAQHFDYELRLKGIDITVYTYRLRRALARIAASLGRGAESREHDAIADAIGDAVRRGMWDTERGMFSDVDPRTWQRTGVAAAVCFYPYMTDIVSDEHLPGLHRNLFDPARFWPAFPVPSTALDDPLADAEGRWRGVRRLCPWNGRVWPMTNSHVIEALGVTSAIDASLRPRAAELIAKTMRMLCLDGDPSRPTSCEHYSPHTGRPAHYRGLDDYLHAFLDDLVIRWAAGFRPTDDGFVVDPLPLDIEHMRLERLPFRGARLTIAIDARQVSVTEGTRTWRSGREEVLRVQL